MPDVLRKADRELCWSSRDAYWDCVKMLVVEDDVKPNDALIRKKCGEYRKQYEANCPNTWIGLFDKKKNFELFKSKKLEENIKESVRSVKT